MFRRSEPHFYAFDLLSCNGEDLRYFPLAERKHRLRGVVPPVAERLLYCDHVEECGEHLFQRKETPLSPRQLRSADCQN